MTEKRPIDANDLMARFFRKECLMQGHSAAASAAYKDAQKTVAAASTVSLWPEWRNPETDPPKAVEEALQKVAYEHPDFGMLRPVCVEEQKLVAAYWQGTSAPRRQWKIVHKYKVEYRSPVSNRELLKKSYVWAVSAEEAVGYAKENVGISGLIVNAEESNESDS